jgi:signal transduction histidine kinase
MAVRGQPTGETQSMFEGSVVKVVLVSAGVAVVAAVILAAVLGPRLARPIREVGAAARRVAQGEFGARIPRGGPQEIVSLADSFNQMAASLEEQERMRREFIANAAHELRTPLTNLKGYLEALRDGVISPDRTTFESLLEEADRLVRLSRSLDTLAEGDVAGPPALAELDLGRAIRAAVELVQPAIRAAGLELRLDVPDRLPVQADADRLAQILGNLLQNAIRYTPAGGRVEVEARRRPADVVVSVSNSGAGIPEADLPHVFERFYRVEKSRDVQHGGAGIGLAIVRQLVEASGGTVGAESRAGMTRVWFSLPA